MSSPEPTAKRWTTVRRQLADLVSTRDPEATLPDLIRSLGPRVEDRPSLLATLGTSAVELLASVSEVAAAAGKATVPRSVLFTDLEGFTVFTAREGDGAAAAMLADHYAASDRIVREHGGRVVKRLGDGLLLSFREPKPAVLAALTMIDESPQPLRVRAGLHYGPVVRDRSDLVGHVVNVSARIAEIAKGSELLVSGEVRERVTEPLPDIEFGRLRTRRLKGVAERVEVCRVRRLS
jgi:class 3 adenylate cyclase